MPLDDFTALIGRNDIGKSTLLEAMEVFLDSQTVKIEAVDACVGGADKIVDIRCIFEELPASLTLDARSETTLEAEWILNRWGNLETVKIFDCGRASSKATVCAHAHTRTPLETRV